MGSFDAQCLLVKSFDDVWVSGGRYNGLPAAEQAKFMPLTVPTKISDYKQNKGKKAASPATTVHTGVTCDASGMHPIVGPRYHKIGEDVDLCEAECVQIHSRACLLRVGRCCSGDFVGRRHLSSWSSSLQLQLTLVAGCMWATRRCSSRFNKLPAHQQAQFLRLDHVTRIDDFSTSAAATGSAASGGKGVRAAEKRKPEAKKALRGTSKRPAKSE